MAFTSKLSQKLTQSERAQGLVELAVIAPILIFMFIGLFEVGYALWGYMTLLNVDREATRFSIRPGALNFATYNVDDIGYSKIITHALASNANQLKLQTYLHNTHVNDPKAAIIISHFVIDTQLPCKPTNQCWSKSTPDCSDATLNATQYTPDDLVLHPELPGYEHLRYKYPEATAFVSRLDAGAVANELKLANNRFNCNLLSKNPLAVPSTNSAIVVEMFYQQPQLLDFPLMSWILNPVPLYVQTTMRIDSDDRGRCEVYPIAMHIGTLTGWTEGGSTVKNIWNGAGYTNNPSGSRYGPASENGWLNWKNDPDADYLAEELSNPRLATNDYENPANTSDDKLQVGDYIATTTGVNNSGGIRDLLTGLKGKTIMIPVWDTFTTSGVNRYHIVRFALVQITDFDLPGGYINARLVDADVDGACQ